MISVELLYSRKLEKKITKSRCFVIRRRPEGQSRSGSPTFFTCDWLWLWLSFGLVCHICSCCEFLLLISSFQFREKHSSCVFVLSYLHQRALINLVASALDHREIPNLPYNTTNTLTWVPFNKPYETNHINRYGPANCLRLRFRRTFSPIATLR